ncbi:MAG: hypothetical protein IPK26_25045 [Planctomycetes bacterium]|nr:hypothetical protein [Planctomycetota bacterium]
MAAATLNGSVSANPPTGDVDGAVVVTLPAGPPANIVLSTTLHVSLGSTNLDRA